LFLAMQSVYIETTIPSYLTSRKSRHVSIAADQEATRAWWNEQRRYFRIFTSVMNNPIIDEVRAARASIAAEHGYDRERILAWARTEQAAINNMNPNKASLPTPDPPFIQAVIAATTSTRRRRLAPGQA